MLRDLITEAYRMDALDLREVLNIAISVFSISCILLFLRYTYREWRVRGYLRLDWPAKLCLGLLVLFCGEFLRSATVWVILHFEGPGASYRSDIAVLTLALLMIIVGGSCIVRVMTPTKWGNSLWISALLVIAFLSIVNFVGH